MRKNTLKHQLTVPHNTRVGLSNAFPIPQGDTPVFVHAHNCHDLYGEYNSKIPAVNPGKESSAMASIQSWLIMHESNL